MMRIATPLASKDQLEMINKIIENTTSLVTGIKACTKEINKENKGIIILTADTTPMDLITHIPALCEEKNVKYLFVERKNLLKGAFTCLFIKREDCQSFYSTLK
ncbi:h aca ribonucleoprotein complex subunit 2 [Vairimorpha ceranae]|uniref:H aca ribonucleoprotein complex subunit 2 n=1 Tax=Vairimorpha ceranae TaxID=40302 RepID=A0A0F9ZH97_9MICR|nr:h aca ribonucleoprotein complex subunit 2 [Vairimorpha ceranae]KAF5141647.1 hypothetical protein G9O61_00g001890 [Vairimorpha ceranae]KKO76634.1 h aca ribonucleoprotein complex subunit 2 [Vairimorpha ceranae]